MTLTDSWGWCRNRGGGRARFGCGDRGVRHERGTAPAVSLHNEFGGTRGKTNAFDSLCRGT
jgi:hypothetical protein